MAALLGASAEAGLTALSLLFLVRVGKVIGAERDAHMAANIRRACRELPHRDLVVVVGMLHCNGIARRIARGDE